VFGLTKVHQFHLEISAKDFEAMQPARGKSPFGFGGPGGKPGGGKPEKPAEKPNNKTAETHRSAFGMEFPWVHGKLIAQGKTYEDSGIRYKGNASYMMSAGKLKRNFKIELDRYDNTLRYRGLKTITLNSGAADPDRMREALAYAIFNAAGVPAPRTAFVEVTLT